MAVPVLESHASTTSGGASSITCTAPSGISADDLLIIFCGSDLNGAVPKWTGAPAAGASSPDYGWIKFQDYGPSAAKLGVFYKRADGTEGDVQLDIESYADITATYCRISGVDWTDSPEAPIEVSAFNTDSASSPSVHNITGVTTSTDDCLILAYLSADTGSFGYSPETDQYTVSGAGWSEVVETYTGTTSTAQSSCLAQRDLATAGASGTCVISGGPGESTAFCQVAIKPTTSSGTSVTSTLGTLSFTAYASTVSAAVDSNITSTLGTLSFTAYASTVSTQTTHNVTSTLATMSMTPYASSVVQGTQYTYSFSLGSVLQYEVTAVDDFSISGVQHSRVTRGLKNRRFELLHRGLTAQDFADILAIYNAQDTRTIYYMNRWFGCRMDEPPQVVENHGNNKVTIKVIMRGSPL